jgi:threonine dehydratase
VHRTPILRSDALDELLDAEVYLKAECMQHIGAFKARGALYAVGSLSEATRARGVITFSSGNHAQAVALAAKAYGVPCAVAMPEDAPPIKVEAVRALGADIKFAGTTSDHRRDVALAMAATSGARIIQPFDDAHIIAGQGTATLELLEDAGELDVLYVPVGGGGLIAGACLVAQAHGVRVCSVEPEGCDALAQSLERGGRVTVEPRATIADGLKPVRVGELNFAIARHVVQDPLRVDDDAIGRALTTLALRAHVVVEPSGATGLAGAILHARQHGHRRVGVILSGGNISGEQLAQLLQRYPPLA